MTRHTTGTREEWLAARLELLEAEKDLARRGDELARRRQALPWVRVDQAYRFDKIAGTLTPGERLRLCDPPDPPDPPVPHTYGVAVGAQRAHNCSHSNPERRLMTWMIRWRVRPLTRGLPGYSRKSSRRFSGAMVTS